MKPPRPKESLEGQACPSCGKGLFRLVQITHREEVPDDDPLELTELWVERCNRCGETVFPAETSRFIEQALAERSEQLTPRELENLREDLGVDQTEMSEVLGLGGKTYHRWENGHQYPSRSMGYYLRVLHEHREAFEWLRERGWRRKSRIRQAIQEFDLEKAFPNLTVAREKNGAETAYSLLRRGGFNPAQAFQDVAHR